MKQKVFVLLSIALFFIAGCVPDHFTLDQEYGAPGSAQGEFLSPTDMALLPQGDLIVADSGNNRIQCVSPDTGQVKFVVGEDLPGSMRFQGIAGIGIHPLTGDIWVCDQRGNKLVKLSNSGSPYLRVVDPERIKYPIDCAVDRNGNVYVILSKCSHILKYDNQGQFISKVAGTGKTALLFPTSIFVAGENLMITDYAGRRILKLTCDGEYLEEFNKKGQYEEIRGPSNIFVDSSENIFLLDLGEVPIVMLSSKGELISKIGSFGNEKGKFLYPRALVLKSDDNILILDGSRNVILDFKKKS